MFTRGRKKMVPVDLDKLAESLEFDGQTPVPREREHYGDAPRERAVVPQNEYQPLTPEPTIDDLGLISAEGVVQEYEKVARTIEEMGRELIQMARDTEKMVEEVKEASNYVNEAAQRYREEAENMRRHIQRVLAKSRHVREACADAVRRASDDNGT